MREIGDSIFIELGYDFNVGSTSDSNHDRKEILRYHRDFDIQLLKIS